MASKTTIFLTTIPKTDLHLEVTTPLLKTDLHLEVTKPFTTNISQIQCHYHLTKVINFTSGLVNN